MDLFTYKFILKESEREEKREYVYVNVCTYACL